MYCRHDIRSGLLGAAIAIAATGAGAPEEGPIIALPPFLVEEVAKGPPWRYGEAGGYEILSRCRDATTRRVVEAHQQLHVLLAEILPVRLQLALSQPRALILYDEELQPTASQEVVARLLRDPADSQPADTFDVGRGGFRAPSPSRRYSFLPNMRLWDRDAMMVFMIVRRDSFDTERLALTPDYIAFLVRSRVPSLPTWFVTGFLSLYGQTNFRGSYLTVDPLRWVTAIPSSVPKSGAGTPPLPLGDFFAGRLPAREPGAGTEPLGLWSTQSALFVRWGLDERDEARRTAFWKFVERAAVEGTNERLFEQCFGFDFARGSEELLGYLPSAVKRTMKFRPGHSPAAPSLVLRNATDGQIARIKGDWERLEVPYVKAISAPLTAKYLEQARRTLRRAYERDERDPRLLAVMGLCECDAGNDAGAREYLEAAVRIGPVRPRAEYELARLRFAEFVAHPAADGRLDTRQMVEVLTPLFAARAAEPRLPEVYELIAEVWAHASATPSRGHLAVLDEGVRLFPRRTALALRAAELNLRHGFRAEASALVEIAARTATDPEAKARIAALEQQLAK